MSKLGIQRSNLVAASVVSAAALVVAGLFGWGMGLAAGSGSPTVPVQQLSPTTLTGTTNYPTLNLAATPHLPPPDGVIESRQGNQVTVNLTVLRKDIQIAPGVVYHAWTFDGTVPGPVIRLTVGDVVHVNVTNADPVMEHSIDFHAAQVAPSVDYTELAPGTTKSFDFTPNHAGVFMYHCGSPLVIQHMANGMYGAIIVDPKVARAPAREYVIVQSEFYTAPDPATQLQDEVNGNAQLVVFNGYWDHYKIGPLLASPGQLIRLYVVDAGPNYWSAFHVIGALFSTVEASGNPANQLQWVQTATVAPGDGAVFELTIPDAGVYPFVTHSFGDVNKGAVGAIKVEPDAPAQPLVP